MSVYNLGFISDENIYAHVRNTVLQYRRSINLQEFNRNIVDPIKMIFDAKIYGQSMQQAIEAECVRQIDKTNNNRIGYFHQYLFRYAGDGWCVPENGAQGGFDVLNDELHIYVEMKNKHNTMNASSASDTYIKMQNKILRDDQATCLLVETIAVRSQDIVWKVTINNGGRRESYSHERIRRVSMDRFYERVFHDQYAFYKLCRVLPQVLDDVIANESAARLSNTVYEELGTTDFYRSIYLLAFRTYEGFDQL